jgi:autotransporter adhesin
VPRSGNSVVLGVGSVADVAHTISVRSIGPERKIVHVAAAQLNDTSTEAVNGSQLFATNQAVAVTTPINHNSVQYDNAAETSVTLGGDVAMGTKVSNVAQGTVLATRTDAGNRTQLNETNSNVANHATNIAGDTTATTALDGRVTAPEGTVGNSGTGSVGMFQVSQDHNASPPAPIGLESAAGGANATASGHSSVAIATTATLQETTAAHWAAVPPHRARAPRRLVRAQRLRPMAVSLWATVPVMVAAAEKTEQDDQLVEELHRLALPFVRQQGQHLGSRADGGIASAMASLPQACQPNQRSASVAPGNFHGETGIAVGMSTISESGRYIFKLNATKQRIDGARNPVETE